MPPITVNEDDDSLPDERLALEAREKGEPLTTLPVDDEAPAAAAADATPPAGDTPPAEPRLRDKLLLLRVARQLAFGVQAVHRRRRGRRSIRHEVHTPADSGAT